MVVGFQGGNCGNNTLCCGAVGGSLVAFDVGWNRSRIARNCAESVAAASLTGWLLCALEGFRSNFLSNISLVGYYQAF